MKAANSTTDKISPIDKIARLEALFLNRVENLRWYYFQINLNGTNNIQPADLDVDEFFEKFENSLDGTGFKFKTPNNDILKILSILLFFLKRNPDILRNVVLRIFDSNDILNRSEFDKGTMGVFNRKDRDERNKKYNKKIRNNFRKNKDNLVVLAEGDSWFEFPKFRFVWNTLKTDVVRDIVDHISDDDQFAVYSIAAGGDWLSNMLKTGEYIEELPRVSPDVLLVSGGGNDMVGDRRLATMVRNPKLEGRREFRENFEEALIKIRRGSPEFDEKRYRNGLSFLAEEFFSFLNITMVQYFLLFKKLIDLSKYDKMLILTQGYDFSIPSIERRGTLFHKFVNKEMGTGRWLYDPLAGKGITEEQDQKDIIYVMIFEFNEVLIQLAQYVGFKNVFHIDCRGVAKDINRDWYDELHLSSAKFKEVAEVFKKCIRENYNKIRDDERLDKKVYRVKDFL